MRPKKIIGADIYCGAGGTSEGLRRACERLGYKLDLVAVNHWDIAIATHSHNHPYAKHYCTSVDSLDPRKAIPGRHLDILIAGVQCTHFSPARGGRAMDDQMRASAWHVVYWADAIKIDTILIENVPAFLTWGPLNSKGRPIERKKGETFRAFIAALESMTYRVEWRIINCADYGDPTTRKRLFIIARRGHRRIEWPEPSHSQYGEPTLFGQLPKWKTARDSVVDWKNKGGSIFLRKPPKKPLVRNTLRRIFVGLKKFNSGPFVIGQQSSAAPRSTDEPIPAVATAGAISIAEPYLVEFNGTGNSHSVSEPVPSATGRDRFGLTEPFLLNIRGGEDGYTRASPADAPVPAVTAESPTAIIDPHLVQFHGGEKSDQRSYPVDEPLRTVDGSNRYGLVNPHIIQMDHSRSNIEQSVKSVDATMPTITTADAFGLADPYIVTTNHGESDRAYSVTEPFRSVTSVDAWGLAEPLIAASEPQTVRINWDAIEEKFYEHAERGLGPLEIAPGLWLDVLFRMMVARELARAQGFSDDYEFFGSRENQVKQIGNAVPTYTAEALCSALI